MADILGIAGQVFSTDFWSRIFTRPHEAVLAHPDIALKSALIAGATVATGGLALKVAPAVIGASKALLAAAVTTTKVAAAPLSFAVRHPIAALVIAGNVDLPTELVRTFGQIYGGAPSAPPAPVPAPVAPPVPATTVRQQGVPTSTRGPVPGVSPQFQAMFAW